MWDGTPVGSCEGWRGTGRSLELPSCSGLVLNQLAGSRQGWGCSAEAGRGYFYPSPLPATHICGGEAGKEAEPQAEGLGGEHRPARDKAAGTGLPPGTPAHTHTSLSLFQHLILSATKQDPKTSGKKKKKEKAGWGHSRVSPGPAEHSRGSAVAEEALREVELEGLQAHRAPARGEKGEVGSPLSASRQVWGEM